MAITQNSKEKQELFKTIWALANELRGKVSGWEFKSYVLGTLFYRYLSENITSRVNQQAHESGDTAFDYAKCSDDDIKNAKGFKENTIKDIGFFLYPSELFCNVYADALEDNTNLNETIETIFNNIESSAKGTNAEKCFDGLFDDFDTSSNNLGKDVPTRNEHLLKLLGGISRMDFGEYTSNTVDLLGDAYEYLMGMYAANAGKAGGEYYTPQEVSTLLTKLCLLNNDGTYKERVNKVYDPTCGSGSLLLKSAKILGSENVEIGYFGQECNPTTYNLCRINMFLHNIPYDKFDIACDDTLINPQHKDDEPFEVIVSNPPYSISWVGDDDVTLINDPRFSPAGVLAPKSKADLAFIMHSLSWLAPTGKAAIVCFPGIMYRGGAEQKIRQYLIDNNYVDSIIQLPDNLFFGTSIATCIMTLSKHKPDNKVLFIDATKQSIHDTNSNRLSDENIESILTYYKDRKDLEYVARLVDYDEVKKNKYNLSVSTYVEKEDTRTKVDIKELNTRIANIIAKETTLRTEIDEIIKVIENGGGKDEE